MFQGNLGINGLRLRGEWFASGSCRFLRVSQAVLQSLKTGAEQPRRQ